MDEKAIACALDILSRRDHSVYELRTKLLKKDFSERQTQEALDYCIGRGYLDDRRFAISFVRTSLKKYSARAIMLRLRNKGIDRYVARTAIEEAGYDELAALETELRRMLRGQAMPETGSREYQKLCQSLIRKGYDYSSIRRIVYDGSLRQ